MDNKLRITCEILAIAGLIDSAYLTWIKLTGQYAICGPVGDCESVNSSPYAEIAGIPIALLGAGAYFLIIVLLVLEPRAEIWAEYGPLVVFGVSLVGVLYSAYLTYLEIAVIRAFCPYCVVSAIVLLLLLIISSVRLMGERAEISAVS
ncbi:MAG TPA: vitamin K epoxide reductase family protein [Anaerolineales bacterium]|nr:vitamin K epoxide reductase family protein [Anaerolineales bacterium]